MEFFLKYGYDLAFEQLKTNKDNELIKSCIEFINDSYYFVKPTKEQFKIFKKYFEDNKILNEKNELEFKFINYYSKDYLIQAYDDFENNEFQSKILSLILIAINDTIGYRYRDLKDLYNIILSNLNNFNREFSIEIINFILKTIEPLALTGSFNSIIVIIILSLIDNIGIEYIKKNYRKQLYKLFMSIDNRNFIPFPPHCELYFKITYLFDRNEHLEIYNELIWKLLYLEGATNHNEDKRQYNGSNKDLDDLLIKIFKSKQEKQIILSTIYSSKSTINDNNNKSQLLPDNLETTYNHILEPIVMNCQCNLFESLINIFKLIYSRNALFGKSYSLEGEIVYLSKYLKNIPFHKSLELLDKIVIEGHSNSDEVKKKFYSYMYGIDNQVKQYSFIFKINGPLIKIILSQEFDLSLQEMFALRFNKLARDNNLLSYLENEISSYLSPPDENPVKFKFVKSKLNYLLELLPLGYIDQYLVPLFKEECIGSKIYKIKKENQIQLNNPEVFDKFCKFPIYLLKFIIGKLLENPKTTMYEKLEISLLSKSYFEFTIETINNSLEAPVKVNYLNSYKIKLDSKYSLIRSNAKYVKTRNRVKRGNGSIMDPPVIDGYRVAVIYDFNFSPYINKSNQFNEIEIFDFMGEINGCDFIYLMWLKSLKKFIARTTIKFALEYKKQLFLLKNKGVEVELHLYNGILKEYTSLDIDTTLPPLADSNWLLKESIISLPFFNKNWYQTFGFYSSKITLQIPEYDKGDFKLQTRGLQNKLSWVSSLSTSSNYKKYSGKNLIWSNLKCIHLEFIFDNCKKLFNNNNFKFISKLFSYFKNNNNNLNQIIITFSSSLNDSPKDLIEFIFKFLSTSIYFSNVETILINNNFLYSNTNPFGGLDIENWNFYQYQQQVSILYDFLIFKKSKEPINFQITNNNNINNNNDLPTNNNNNNNNNTTNNRISKFFPFIRNPFK